MSLEDLANLGEFVGAIGVVLSLIYLAVQIRQKSRGLGLPCGFLPGDGVEDAEELPSDGDEGEPLAWFRCRGEWSNAHERRNLSSPELAELGEVDEQRAAGAAPAQP